MRIKLNGTILESNNPLVVEQWQKAGYAEVGEERKPRKGKEPEKGQPLAE